MKTKIVITSTLILLLFFVILPSLHEWGHWFVNHWVEGDGIITFSDHGFSGKFHHAVPPPHPWHWLQKLGGGLTVAVVFGAIGGIRRWQDKRLGYPVLILAGASLLYGIGEMLT